RPADPLGAHRPGEGEGPPRGRTAALRNAGMGQGLGDAELARRRLGSARSASDPRRPAPLGGLPWAAFPERTFESAWWVFPVLAPHRDFRDRVRAKLADAGVETRTYFVPLHRQPHLRKYAAREYPVADSLAARGFYLPLYPELADDDVDYICEILREL
ncbi:MAG TPA: DegT/DnrJ/EryC1/StrS family aminotransferase, partial [Pirellulales bacterium]|nr:DegT/DnrJ/EryC1/StrS family aminotransferase [Pirellulales bacterium]